MMGTYYTGLQFDLIPREEFEGKRLFVLIKENGELRRMMDKDKVVFESLGIKVYRTAYGRRYLETDKGIDWLLTNTEYLFKPYTVRP